MRRNRFGNKIGLENIFMFRTPSKRARLQRREVDFRVHCTTFFEAGCAAPRTVVDPATARSQFGLEMSHTMHRFAHGVYTHLHRHV